MPWDCGLSSGVVHGTTLISWARTRVLRAAYGEPLSDNYSSERHRVSGRSTARPIMPVLHTPAGVALEQQLMSVHDA